MAAANPDYADALAGDPREILLSRRIAAPRALVWQAFTSAAHIAPWWGPDGFRTTVSAMDVRPGGEWRFTMQGPDGTVYPNHVRYLEVTPPERLVYLHGDGSGDAARSFQVTLSFEAEDAAHTRVTLRTRFASPAARDYVVREVRAVEGGRQTLARLDAYLASGALRATHSSPENEPMTAAANAQHDRFTIDRVFDAPLDRVFAAWATPEAKARWFGGGSPWQELIREFDFRVGGHERLRGRWESGTTSDFRCHYHDIVAERRIVYAYSMFVDDVLISVSLSTAEFAADGARTRLRYTEQAAYLNGYDDAGSRERGTQELLERLAATLAERPAPDLQRH